MARSKIVARSSKTPQQRTVGKESPMMTQFWRAKKEAPDALLFFRMGDFYELFHDDAVTAARAIGLTLTSRSKGSEDPVPMAGVPVKAAEGYLVKLVRMGHKVAVCEQLEDPREAKGIVERGIVRIVTPGTLTEEDALDARSGHWLAALFLDRRGAALAWLDLSTGRLAACELAPDEVPDEMARLRPAELLVDETLLAEREDLRRAAEKLGTALSPREPWRFAREGAERALARQFRTKGLAGFGIEAGSPIVPAAGALVDYAAETQKASLRHVLCIERVERREHLVLDAATRSCLELVATQREGRREGTLLDAIDATATAMGSRLLREWVLAPLRDAAAIRRRQGGVAELVDDAALREGLRDELCEVLDLERLAGRVATGRANARDLFALASSLARVPALRSALAGAASEELAELAGALDPLEELTARVLATLVDEPPMTVREGGLVRAGVDAELDELRQIAGDAKSWMARFQAAESERSGLPGLKIGFNSVFGYFLEVPRGQLERVPEHYIRKQTIKNAERFITPELKEFETKVLKSEELAHELEYRLFCELRDAAAAELERVLACARALARLDCLVGLAATAAAHRYVAPRIGEGTEIRIVEGRHPVLERSPSVESFVPNDARLDAEERRLTILTGPNMSGKSTYIRQVALITLLAQIGSFVPADEAVIGVVDRIFTRVGAGDDISRGESTFMVEMVEIANILNNATDRSLVILDEVGRGTSTFDGLALAWAIAEHLHERIGARTLFATHYHQLTDLAQRFPGARNMSVGVREWGDEIVFLHKIQEGGTDRSYGIHVARLAGVPAPVLERARAILADLERDEEDLAERILAAAPAPERRDEGIQLGLFASRPSLVEEELRKLELDRLTPIDALVALRELKGRLEG